MEHCDECDICVEGYDHHCGVVGVCIGDTSFKYFVQFIIYSGLIFVSIGCSSIQYNASLKESEIEDQL